MKNTLITIAAVALLAVLSCTKETGTVSNSAAPTGQTAGNSEYGMFGHTARYSATDYSQSIPLDSANRMLASYLGGVGYPAVDTALRSLSFDADTLRAYLQNPNIVTMKFMLAHKQSYINGGNAGAGSGLNANAITLIVVGLNNNDEYVLNNRNEVYDHFANCPQQCPGSAVPYIQ